MFLNEGKTADFLRNHPKFETLLTDLYNDEVAKTCLDLNKLKRSCDLDKKHIIDYLNQKVSYNTSEFKNPSEKGFKYKLELLGNDDPNYNFLKDSLSLDKKVDLWLGRHPHGNNKFKIERNQVAKLFKMYKVIPNVEVENRADCEHLLLLHGTKAPNIKGILKEGFKDSASGSYGPGVYLTNSCNMACNYGRCYGQENDTIKKLTYLFVNRIKPADEPKSPREFNESNEDYLNKEPTLRAFNSKTKKSVSLEDNDQSYIDDKYNITIQRTFQNVKPKIFLAHHDLVTPAYLIEIEEQQNVKTLAKDLLYNPSVGVKKYTTEDNELPVESNIYNEENICSPKNLNKALKEEISVNEVANLEHIKARPQYVIDSVVEQFLFQVKSLFESSKDDKAKYTSEILKKNDKDYQFILQSLTKKIVRTTLQFITCSKLFL